MRCSIEFKADKKPENLSVGGFSAISKDGRKYDFDFLFFTGDCSKIEDGYIISVDLYHLDKDFIEENNESVSINEITPSFIANSEITEIAYSAEDTNENPISLKLISLELIEVASLSEAQIKKYNSRG